MVFEVELFKFASPLYFAPMEWVPETSVEVVNLAVPLLTGIAAETGMVPSKNTTVPVAVLGDTVAVNVAGAPALKVSSAAATTIVD